MQLQALLTSLFTFVEIFGDSIQTQIINGNTYEDGVNLNCTYQMSQMKNKYNFYLMIFSCISIVIMGFFETRRSFKLDWKFQRPGILIGTNMIYEHMHTLENIVMFIAVSEEIYSFLFESESVKLNPIAKFFMKLSMILFLNTLYYPAFAAVKLRNLVGFVIALILSIGFVLISIFDVIYISNCFTGIKLVPLYLNIFVHIAFDFFIVVIFSIRLIQFLRIYKCDVNSKLPEFDNSSNYNDKYVRNLLIKLNNKKDQLTETNSTSANIKYYIQQNVEKKVIELKNAAYKSIPGFSIPPKLLIGISVGLFFAWRILIDSIEFLTPLGWKVMSNLNDKLVQLDLSLGQSFKIASFNDSYGYTAYEISNSYEYLVIYYAYLLLACLVFSIIFGVINSIFQSFLLLRSYRLNFAQLNAKGFSLSDYHPTPINIIQGYVRFSGYQAAFLLWSIVVLSTTLFFITFLFIGVILLPLIYIEDSWIRTLVVKSAPVVILSFILNYSQKLITYFLFMKSSDHLDINNQRWFNIYNHSMFFLNAMLGLFSSIKRVIVWLVFGLFFFGRIDFSTLPNFLQNFDSGFTCYLGFIYMEFYHHNPILKCFVNLLNRTQLKTNRTDKTTAEINEETSDILLAPKQHNLKYRNKWLVAYTLIKNPKLIYWRKETFI